MVVHRFVFSASPTAAADNASDVAGADVEVWVKDGSVEEAEAKARSLIMGYSWLVNNLEFSESLSDGIFPDQDKQSYTFGLYKKAKRAGIAALFLSLSKVPRPGVFEYRPMDDPPDSYKA
jgi:hypothetical protein